MDWLVLTALGNAVVAAAYFAISGAVAVPLLRSGQFRSNRLGSATAAIFFTCAVGHGIHLLHALESSPETRASYSWHLAFWDLITAVIAVYYWSLRRIYGSLMNGAKLFEDMQEQQRLERAQAAQDLAEARLAAERERHANSAMVTTLIANSQALIYIKDVEGRYLLANDALRAAFDVTAANILGRADAEIPPAQRPGWGVHDAAARTGAVRVEVTAVTAAGPRVYDCALFPLHDADGQVYATCAMATDVTQAKAVEHALAEARDAALASAAARSSFLATMSHEIRTPINAVIGLTGLLLQSPLDDHQRDLLETVRTSGDALLDVVNDVLDFSKIESGEVRLEDRPFDVVVAVDNAVDLVAGAAALKGLELVTRVSPAVPTFAVGDVTRFRQVLLNLLSNAVKFTEAGHIALDVSAEPEGPDRVRLTATVTDTGIGIPAGAVARLFDPFTQVDESTTRIYGGTGLGLAISHRLVEAMGGTMGVDSEEGRGSAFTVTVRVGRVSTDPHPRWKPLRAASVLLIEQPGVFRDRLAAQLEDWDVACTVADDLGDALRLAAEGGLWQVALLPADLAAQRPSDAATLAAGAPGDGPLPLVALTTLQAPLAPLDRTLFRAELATPVRIGALAEVLVPLVAPQAVLPGPRSEAEEFGAALPPLRILLVEDNAVNQKVGRLMLRSLGQEDVEIAGNGREAVESARSRPFDLVLMDVQMPELDGLGATRQIRALDLPWPQPRIIALTAAASGAHRESCAAAGMDEYLSKPVRVDALAAAMRGIAPGIVPARSRTSRSAQTLDREVLRALLAQLGRTESTADDLVTEFLTDTAANLGRIRTALAAADQAEIARIAHEMRPTCALFGAAELSALLAGLETGTRPPDAGARLDAAFERLRGAFGLESAVRS